MSKKKKTIEELLEEALVPEAEQPYEIPDNWIWSNAGAVSKVLRGVSYKKHQVEVQKNDNNLLVLRGGNIQDGTILNQGDNVYVSNELVKEEQRLQKNDVVIVSSTGSSKVIGKAASVINEFVGESFGAFLTTIRPSKKIDSRYFGLYYQTANYRNVISSLAKGSNINNIKKEHLDSLSFPQPPLDEQKRIVEKVESLLGKVEEAKQLIDEAKETFELRRAAILDKAFRGELTRKWREKNADIDIFEVQEHLDRLRADKESSPIKSNTLNVKSVNEVDEPFNLPRGWKWARLGELSYYVTSGSRDWSKYYADNGSYFIRTQDINKNKLNLTNVAYVLLPEKVEGKRSLVEPFDLLTTITGANVGKCAIVEETIPEAYVSQSVALTKLIDKSMAKYVHLSLLSTCGGGGELENRAYGIGRPVLSLEDVKNIRLPIAPYRERQVMVNMVKKLLDMEETTGNLLLIEEKLDQLKNSILSKAFRGKLGTNDPTEENAIELLKEVLQEQVK
ncbi:restriction endonuclease subunit S [Bacillus velezensis]|uniref:restriction endonuclease subunit S n=1 Tax=Bacillus velezensis TaxID=492670 RepID=UPI002DBC3658|nr:restriction endonuclease subunit S [Bacillus velezensis]MEC2149685.1 restriction endonuclease subunit S [Bacillus velezensis]MEC2155783.1 restriction endonuclease subunit S [Bacillus velezensis]